MIPYDVREHLFSMVDEVAEHIVPQYRESLYKLGIDIPYLWLDNALVGNFNFSMEDKAIWFYTLSEIAELAQKDGLITEKEMEDIMISETFKV